MSFRNTKLLAHVSVLLALCVVTLTTLAAAHAYGERPDRAAYTTFDAPGAGQGNFTGTFPTGINARGQIVGNSEDDVHAVGFLLSRGIYTVISPANALNTFVNAINDRGQIVGNYDDGSATHGFLLDHGVYNIIKVPAAGANGFTNPTGINDRGQIVGIYTDGNFAVHGVHGFLFDHGVYTTIDAPNSGIQTVLTGINARGQIIGSSLGTDLKYQAFVIDRGVYVVLDDSAHGKFGISPTGINAEGEIVGSYSDSSFIIHGFLLDGGIYKTLDDPNAFIDPNGGTFPAGINEQGQIVGFYGDSTLTARGFLLHRRNFELD